ncbi:MAG: HRDC domain-containing protein [Myxococcota bacterium]
MRPFHYLDASTEPAGIGEHLARVAASQILALDTEGDSFHRYVDRVCLIQLSTETEDVIVDPLAHGLPESLRAILADPSRAVVLHGADYDVLSLRRDFDLILGNLFDTMIAARFLGRRELGLQALAQNELGVRLEKDEQRSDWGARPLSDKQISYARQDTQHLIPLADRLSHELDVRGRLSWVLEDCALLSKKVPVPREVDEDAWRKLKGVRELPDVGQRAAKAAFLWREKVSAERNRPPFRVLSNEVLVAIVRDVVQRGVSSLDGLSRRRGVGAHIDAGAMAAAIREGLERPIEKRKPSGGRPPPLSREGEARLGRLKSLRAQWAEAEGLDPSLLMSASLMDAIARAEPLDAERLRALPGMTEWRAAVVERSV